MEELGIVKPMADGKAVVNMGTIRQSTNSDLEAIRSWLHQEEAAGVRDTFLCNWAIIERCHDEGSLTVYVDDVSGLPVAFQLNGLTDPGILQVRSDMRRRGIGKQLVEHCVRKAIEEDECFLMIECKPESSIPFWTEMGFILYGEQAERKRAYRILPKRHVLPTTGIPIDVTVRYYPEDRKWNGGLMPYETSVPTAVRTPDGIIHLSERVSFCQTIHPDGRDPVVEITIDGQRRYLGKAKYPEANKLGIRRCNHGFYCDRVSQG
jgi:GNAT superfamily N-acetyltransferase